MLRWLRRVTAGNSEHRANGLAAGIAFTAVTILYLEAPPVPAGADSLRIAHRRGSPVILESAPVGQALASVVEPGPVAVAADLTPAQQAEQTLRRKMELIERGRKFLETVPDYTAQFMKQELVDGELTEEQQIEFKCRHQPFSVYLKWQSGDVGRELLYVDGANDGEMVVHAGGWKARLPSLSISPTSSLAMGEARYPITNVGLLELAKTMLANHADDLAKSNVQRCEQLKDQEFEGRKCDVFVVEYKDAAGSPTYRKSVVLFDKEWSVPLYTKNFGWPDANTATQTAAELDDATLIEFYTYSDVQLRLQLADADFDRTNEEYRFK
jgi:hypothetical protein